MNAMGVASLRERFSRLIKDFESDVAFLERGNYLFAGPIMSPTDITEDAKQRTLRRIAELESIFQVIDRKMPAGE